MCGTSRNVVACSIVKNKNSKLNEQINAIRNACEIAQINAPQ
jgi:U4/U6 small nuclear ribonucleoprotein SNU13